MISWRPSGYRKIVLVACHENLWPEAPGLLFISKPVIDFGMKKNNLVLLLRVSLRNGTGGGHSRLGSFAVLTSYLHFIIKAV